MSGSHSREKGKRGEREARDQVRTLWGCPSCKRSAQVSGQFTADLIHGPKGLHLEVKSYAHIAALKHLAQAERDAASTDTPVVLLREARGDWAVMVRMTDAVDFARRLLDALDDDTRPM